MTVRKNTPLAVVLAAALSAAAWMAHSATPTDAEALARYKTAERIDQEHLKKFDTLDFDIYSNQKWERFKENHSPDILVHYPDGHTIKGLAAHIAALKP